MSVTLPTPETMTLVCYKCTREHRIGCEDAKRGAMGADMLGWAHDGYGAICPRCPKPPIKDDV